MKLRTKISIFLLVTFVIICSITLTARTTNAPVLHTNSTQSPVVSTQSTATTSPASSLGSVNGSKVYILSDVAKHNTAVDCWTVVDGRVYDLSSFVHKHPGGVEAISQICGVDGTVIFTKMHGSTPAAIKALATLNIGILSK